MDDEWYKVSATTLLTAVIGILLIARFHQYFQAQREWKKKRYPNGPIPLPIVGNSHQAGADFPAKWTEMSKTYGPVFCFKILTRDFVIVNGYENIMQTRQSDDYGDRDLAFLRMSGYAKPQHGIIWNTGESAFAHRKIVTKYFSQLGAGRSKLEDIVLSEVEAFSDVILSDGEVGRDYRTAMATAIANITCQILFGKKFNYKDEKFMRFIQTLDDSFRQSVSSGIVAFLPLLQYLPGDIFEVHQYEKNVAEIFDFMRENINERLTNCDDEDKEAEKKDIVTGYFLEMRRDNNNSSVDYNLESLEILCYEMFIAGTHTTAQTLMWIYLYLIRYPEAQQFIRTETTDQALRDKKVTLKSRGQMPYTRAFITEVQRIANVAAFTASGKTTCDTDLANVTIPKGTVVMTNYHSVHFDPETYPDPYEFNPNRHINSDGKYQRHQKFIPFGEGPRICLGQSLADIELFLFTANVVKNFDIRVPEGCQLPSDKGIMGVTRNVIPYTASFTKHHE